MNEEQTSKKIIEYLAEHLGVESDDIKLEDPFTEQLHMNAAQLIDFINYLKNKGVDVEGLELEHIKTVSDLLEALNVSEEESKT